MANNVLIETVETTGRLLGKLMVHEATGTIGVVIEEELPANGFVDSGATLRTADGEAVEFAYGALRPASEAEREIFPRHLLQG